MEHSILNGLCPHIVELSADVNANHVVKRCMAGMDAEVRERVVEAVIAHCIEVGVRGGGDGQIGQEMYGCGVVQKCIDVASGAQAERLLDCIEANACVLMKDMYANYLIQVRTRRRCNA